MIAVVKSAKLCAEQDQIEEHLNVASMKFLGEIA